MFRRLLAALAGLALTAGPALAGPQKPLTLQSGQFKQLQSGDSLTDANGAPFAREADLNVFAFMSAAQISDVRACTKSLDTASAINAALAAGRRVTLPAGCYKTSASIVLPNNAQLVGESMRGTVIAPTGNFPAIQAIGTYASGLTGITVRNLSVSCAGMANTSAMGVKLVYVNRGLLRDLYFNGCYHALDLYDQWQTVVDGVTADGQGAQQNYIGAYLGAPTDAANANPNNAVIMSNSTMQNVSTYGYQLVYFAGSKFVNDEAMNGVTGWKLCAQSYVVTVACHFGHFVNILSDTTSGASIDIQQGANSLPVTDVMFDHVWIGTSNTYGLYTSGVIYSQFDNVHITSADAGIYAQNGNNLKFSAQIQQYNKSNNSSYAVTLDGVTASSVQALNAQSANPIGYNGIREINTSAGNSIWGGLAACSSGLTFGGGGTGLTFGVNSCQYEVRGQQVRVQAYLGLSAVGSSTGAALLTGLPFTVEATPSAAYGGTGVAVMNSAAGLSGPVLLEAAPGTTTVNLYSQGATGASALTNSNFTNSTVLSGAVEYTKK